MLISERGWLESTFLGIPELQIIVFHMMGLWVSYNWARAGLGTYLVRHVNKQKEKEKKKNKLSVHELSLLPEDEKQVEQSHKNLKWSQVLMIKEDCAPFDVTEASTD